MTSKIFPRPSMRLDLVYLVVSMQVLSVMAFSFRDLSMRREFVARLLLQCLRL
jgi:hypothetical protein